MTLTVPMVMLIELMCTLVKAYNIYTLCMTRYKHKIKQRQLFYACMRVAGAYLYYYSPGVVVNRQAKGFTIPLPPELGQ